MKKLVLEDKYAWYERFNAIYEYGKTRVYLVNNEDYEYCEEHPCVDSDYECYGVVLGHSGPNKLHVRWENGCENAYNPEDLDIMYQRAKLDAENPNRKFKEKKYNARMARAKEAVRGV